MHLENKKIGLAIHPAYFNQHLLRADVEVFKANFRLLLSQINQSESEEHNKNIVSNFLKNTYYKDIYSINTADRKDLVVHTGQQSHTPVGVIVETKSPGNKAEMVSFDKPNVKSLHELMHYFMHERLIKNNLQLKHLVITNGLDWYIFDAKDFENNFFINKIFKNNYQSWYDKKLSGTTTDWFYTQIAKPFVDTEIDILPCVHIHLPDYKDIIENENAENEHKIIHLYKIFSPQHLLKLPFANETNKIDVDFYNELLHILGLEETLHNGLLLITRLEPKDRLEGSILENAIAMTHNLRRLKHLNNLELFGETEPEQLFSIGLELTIIWLNRILFLKLLEAQLIKYHKGNNDYAFLNIEKIADFEQINELFFEVLAKKQETRTSAVSNKFKDLPYLNSSLFEQTELEDNVLYISQLKSRLTLPLSKQTVLKDSLGNRKTGHLPTLQYLFQFLNAYSFSSDSKAEIQDNSRTIINAAVLGLIFEKINGYKDGSFYTPSFITSYMSREVIKNTLLCNFSKKWNKKIEDFEALKGLIDYSNQEERQLANEVINTTKIIDPAVGSGHFLVSVLNELVSIKSELKILQDPKGNRLRGINVSNVSDELVIINEEISQNFEYYVNDRHIPPSEIQLVQETLFYEKKLLIENCIFGVDINPKSVLICRLRIWIELLKSAFYTSKSNYQHLETLPNIDINIKAGNSLISKFDTGLNIFERASVNDLIKKYKIVTNQYKNSTDYDEKDEIRKTIKNIKSELQKYAIPKDKYYRQYLKKNRELEALVDVKPQNNILINALEKLTTETLELKQKYESNYYYLYQNSLEWAIDFPEILSDNGSFEGFDIVIGNPPYFTMSHANKLREVNENYQTYKQSGDIYMLFIERGLQILKPEGRLSMITSNKWMRAAYGEILRNFLLKNATIDKIIDFDALKVFDRATVDTSILELTNHKNGKSTVPAARFPFDFDKEDGDILKYFNENKILLSDLGPESWDIATEDTKKLLKKIKSKGKLLEDWDNIIHYGIKNGFNKAFFIDSNTKTKLIAEDPKSAKIIQPFLRGRDVHKFYIDKKDQFLINTYNGKLIDKINPKTNKKTKVRIDRIEVEKKYPAIYQHLLKYKSQLEARTDKGIDWTNHRNCAYQDLFFENKIIFPETTGRRCEFYYDKHQFLIDKTCFMLTGSNLKYLMGILTSKVIEFYFETIGRTLGKSAIQYSKQYMDKLPIPEITDANKSVVSQIEALVDEITDIKEKNNQTDTTKQTKKINSLVYQLYQLNKDDITFIENELKE